MLDEVSGKLGCGFLGARLGITCTIMATKGLTAIVIAGLLLMPLGGALALLPLLGLMLNGTSSVLYGSVPDFAAEGNRPRAFGVFYTITIGAAAGADAAGAVRGSAADASTRLANARRRQT